MARTKSNTSTTWDPVLLISQIISLQALHYLVLSLLIPPLLHIFADKDKLNWAGGASGVGWVMDWREMAGRAGGIPIKGGAWAGGKVIGYGASTMSGTQADPIRAWVIATTWITACFIDILPIYHLIRRPRLILDFSLTLVFNHLVLTSYYAGSIPTSVFFWLVMAAGAGVMVVGGEQVCVRREMREGLKVDTGLGRAMEGVDEEEEIELLEAGERRE
ncbi:hypothetical protein VNI00_019192 [Paramarasmius palmivorus]|uniref:Uncharacterized protein n=1 Tax=Paramarasmius palmivorus TaxID=297713 RepID=A0AAW0ARI4_9AGAR